MNRYLITIILANGDRVEAKSVGESQEDAIKRLEETQQFTDFVADNEIVSIDISFLGEVKPVQPERYVLQKSRTRENAWVVTDTVNNVVVVFEEGRYNETARITPLYDFPEEPVGTATILREIGEYLAEYHKELI